MKRTFFFPRFSVPRVCVAVAAAALGGCALVSPYWAQTFATTTDLIPIQGFATSNTTNVQISCAKAYHGGLYPPFETPTWISVTTLTPSASPSYDTAGSVVYSVGTRRVLPAACWHADGAYSPPKYMTALRATQTMSDGSTSTYRVFDLAGLECLGRENGKAGSWFGWVNKNCALTYSNSTEPLPYVRIIANALGSSAAAARSLGDRSGMASTDGDASVSTRTERLKSLPKHFEAETIDSGWALKAEAGWRHRYESVYPAGSQLAGVTCKTSMCRVEVHHENASSYERFVAAFANAGLFSNDGIRGWMEHRRIGTRIQAVYFVAREGGELALPALPAQQ